MISAGKSNPEFNQALHKLLNPKNKKRNRLDQKSMSAPAVQNNSQKKMSHEDNQSEHRFHSL